MSETTVDPIVLTAEQIAEHLRWRLSNSNAELDLPDGFFDVAFDTGGEGGNVTLSVSSWNVEADSRGFQQFTLTVVPVSPSETGDQT